MKCRPAIPQDLPHIMEIICKAKDFLKVNGVNQWQSGYPDESDIQADIHSANGYLLADQNTTIGYACISFDGEPAYESISGSWLSHQPYAVIHRLALDSSCRGNGLSALFFQYAEELCRARNIRSIKVDTDSDNIIMQHQLNKYGYQLCGTVRFQDSDKLAYEKLI